MSLGFVWIFILTITWRPRAYSIADLHQKQDFKIQKGVHLDTCLKTVLIPAFNILQKFSRLKQNSGRINASLINQNTDTYYVWSKYGKLRHHELMKQENKQKLHHFYVFCFHIVFTFSSLSIKCITINLIINLINSIVLKFTWH